VEEPEILDEAMMIMTDEEGNITCEFVEDVEGDEDAEIC
jgi:hypothetical protein